MPRKLAHIHNATELQSLVGEPHEIIKAKVLGQLDYYCLAYLEQSPIMFLGFRDKGMSQILILDGAPGFVKAVNNHTLHIPHHQEFSVIDGNIFNQFLPVSLYFWIPGIEETLRINGMAGWVIDNKSPLVSTTPFRNLCLRIDATFLHCAKSVKRSKLWVKKESADKKIDFKNKKTTLLNDNHRMFIALSPFICLHTQNNSNQTELSPRGDPQGFVHILDDTHLLIPDRPGNKRVDSMYNLLDNPRLGIIFLVPGSTSVLKINGKASLVSDSELLQPLAIKNKVPKLGILVSVTQCEFYQSNALNWQTIWAKAAEADKKQFPPLGQILVEQTTKNKSLMTKIKGKIVEAVIKRDYKKNMY